MNLLEEFDSITEHWSPKIVSSVNDQYVKIAKIKGTFVWHDHKDEDEMFYVIKGSMQLEFESETIDLKTGDFYVVAKGRLHRPSSEEECWLMLLEPKSTQHTGDVKTDRTKSIEQQLGQ